MQTLHTCTCLPQVPHSRDKLTSCCRGSQIPSYIQIVGIILGMMTVGFLGDRIGRKWGSVTTVSIMFVRRLLPWQRVPCASVTSVAQAL